MELVQRLDSRVHLCLDVISMHESDIPNFANAQWVNAASSRQAGFARNL